MTSRVVTIHRVRLEQVEAEADALEGAARRLKQMAREVLDRGGMLQAHGIMSYVTGSHARLLKDMGVIEQLQSDGVAQKGRTS